MTGGRRRGRGAGWPRRTPPPRTRRVDAAARTGRWGGGGGTALDGCGGRRLRGCDCATWGGSEVHRRRRGRGTIAAVSAWTRRRRDLAVAWPRGRRRKMRTRPRDGRGGYDAAAAARDDDARAVADAAAGGGDGRAARVEAGRPDVHQGEAGRPRPRSLVMISVEFYEVNRNIINQSQHSVRSNILATLQWHCRERKR